MTEFFAITPTDVLLGNEQVEQLDPVVIARRMELGVRVLDAVPGEVFSKIQFLQPATGCLNACNFCSQEAGAISRSLDQESIKTVLGGLQAAMRAQGVRQIGEDRPHKPGVIFPYLDNDIGSYLHLTDLIKGIHSMNGRTRISTVGWSRLNPDLQAMHEAVVSDHADAVDGIRFSFTPYTLGWRTNPDLYVTDFANALNTYRPLLEQKGTSRGTGCIEVRFAPDVTLAALTSEQRGPYHLLRSGDYTLVTAGDSLEDQEVTRIKSMDGVRPQLDSTGLQALQLVGETAGLDKRALDDLFAKADTTKPTVHENHRVIAQKGSAFTFRNEDGRYYCFNPLRDARGTFNGIHYYPNTEQRLQSGVLDATRPLQNAIMRIKRESGVAPRETMQQATWADVERVVATIAENAATYAKFSPRRTIYIKEQVLPLVQGLVAAMRQAGLEGGDFFRYGFVIDTGVIVNQGKATREFRGLASRPDMPLTPNEEKGYGIVSQSSVRGRTWRIAPVVAIEQGVSMHGFGVKSRPLVVGNTLTTDLKLGFYEWDPGLYDNKDIDGTPLRIIHVPLDGLVSPLEVVTPRHGREHHLLPGSL